ncbi:MAG TPA: FMN-binding protein [Patescibacteria group bacterium]|nr:FMN-binding protein [Patescibacteria group bacterium]
MKKFLLSFFVIAVFVLYSLHQRSEGAPSPVIPPQPSFGPTPSNPPITSQQTNGYKNGTYVGDVTDAFYGFVQVQAIIQGGKITDVAFLQYPNDRNTSIEINSQAMPYLKSEAIQAQSANVDIISGATATSDAFRQSLQSALNKAQ